MGKSNFQGVDDNGRVLCMLWSRDNLESRSLCCLWDSTTWDVAA